MDTLTAELRAEMKVSASLSVYRSDAKRDPLLAAVKSKAPTWAPPQGQKLFLEILTPVKSRRCWPSMMDHDI